MKSAANARPAGEDGPFHRLVRFAAGIEDGAIIRMAFFALLFGALTMLFVDYRMMSDNEIAAAIPTPAHPILPPFDPEGPVQGPMPDITTSPDLLEAPLDIALVSGGTLSLRGTFDPGSAKRFAEEIAARGEYVRTIELDSPGGSVLDALDIGALIHEKGYATEVAAGALCASSCPVVFASGKERIATPHSAIGVHQIYASVLTNDPARASRVAGTAMAEAQTTTARITRRLVEAGVDPAMWLHALETPPTQLYYFSPEEMTTLRLVTDMRQN